jgi:hypothetical protein
VNAHRFAVAIGALLTISSGCSAATAPSDLPDGLREAFEAADEVVEYAGLCDASAVAWIDAERFVVAGDEDNWLRVYVRGVPEPQTLVGLDDFLAVEPEHPEADLEAAAVVGQRIYWLTSHGRNKNAEPRPSRQRFFATNLEGGVLVPAGRPYGGLVAALLGDERYAVFDLDRAARRAPKSPGGLNFEGLAPWADGALLIGARNPVPDGLALLIPLENPEGVALDGEDPVFGEPVRLDLGGRGVRSIESFGDKRFLIAAGRPAGSSDRIYFWTGSPDDAPVPVTRTELNLEGIAYHAEEGRLILVSDDGARLVRGVPCKSSPDVADRRFSTQSVKL